MSALRSFPAVVASGRHGSAFVAAWRTANRADAGEETDERSMQHIVAKLLALDWTALKVHTLKIKSVRASVRCDRRPIRRRPPSAHGRAAGQSPAQADLDVALPDADRAHAEADHAEAQGLLLLLLDILFRGLRRYRVIGTCHPAPIGISSSVCSNVLIGENELRIGAFAGRRME